MNYFVLAVAVLQVAASLYGFYCGDWKQGVCNAGLALANFVFAFMK